MTSPQAQDLGWKINDFNRRVPGVAHVAVVSSDGLLLVASEHLPPDEADHLAAAVSSLASLTHGMATSIFQQDGVLQTLVEMPSGSLLVRTIRDGCILATLVLDSANIGTVGYEMTKLGQQAGELLTPALRQELRPQIIDRGAAPPPPPGYQRRGPTAG